MPTTPVNITGTLLDPKTKSFAIMISVLMVVTGSVNTLAAKWADSIPVEVEHRLFNHPFFQVFVCLRACQLPNDWENFETSKSTWSAFWPQSFSIK
jgi:hypothetical protein